MEQKHRERERELSLVVASRLVEGGDSRGHGTQFPSSSSSSLAQVKVATIDCRKLQWSTDRRPVSKLCLCCPASQQFCFVSRAVSAFLGVSRDCRPTSPNKIPQYDEILRFVFGSRDGRAIGTSGRE